MSRTPSSRAPARKATYHHGDLRRALLDATLGLVDQHGPQGFTLRAAARAAGVTPSATYHHFKDKDDLLTAVAEDGFDDFRKALEAAAQKPAPSARERSRNVGVAYVLFATQHPTLFRVMVGFGVQAYMRQGHVLPSAVATYELVREALVQGLRSRPTEKISEAEVLGWWSVVHGLAFLAIDGHLGDMSSSPRRVEVVVRAVISALDARHQEPPIKPVSRTRKQYQ